MKSQQAVAIRFVGRRVIDSTCLFFGLLRRSIAALEIVAPSDVPSLSSKAPLLRVFVPRRPL
jgi:hypothetical protein